MAIDGVIFDWGGTLAVDGALDRLSVWLRATERLATVTGQDGHDLAAQFLEAERRLWARCEETGRSFTLLDVLAACVTGLSGDRRPAVLEEVSRSYLEVWASHLRHDNHAVSTLRRLRAMGLSIGLLSNTHWPAAFHERLLKRDGLTCLIDVRGYTSEMERAKPDPAAFRIVLDRLGLHPARVVFVGDRLRDDIWGAQQVGMRAVWIRRPGAPGAEAVVPDAVIRHLPALPALLSGWRTTASRGRSGAAPAT
ncbi:MAG TPA: HAD family hydrolase [Acidimicrobiia bacterium]|nr:HAD family hydrolase [Acidimicrobiia bacterium]